MIKVKDRIHVKGQSTVTGVVVGGYGTVIGIDWTRERTINVRYDNGSEDWVYQSWVTVLRPPEIGPETWSTIPTVRLEWLSEVADVAERIAHHRDAKYPTAVKRAEAWWMLQDELQDLIARKP